jgi:hypothetical protein
MAIPQGPRGLSLPQQAIGLRFGFPSAKVTLTPTRLTWVSPVRPTPLSRDYEIQIAYRYGWFPKVVTLDPLESRPGEDLPHVYRDGSLCLHEVHEWAPNMHIVDTIVPWVSEYLAHYELWKVGGHWYGDDDQTVRTSLPVSPSAAGIGNRLARRRERRAQRRRERRSRCSRHTQDEP